MYLSNNIYSRMKNALDFVTLLKSTLADLGQLPGSQGHGYPFAPDSCCSKVVACDGNSRTWQPDVLGPA
jgi:hypothetical protein